MLKMLGSVNYKQCINHISLFEVIELLNVMYLLMIDSLLFNRVKSCAQSSYRGNILLFDIEMKKNSELVRFLGELS